jgi:hypothetical protein
MLIFDVVTVGSDNAICPLYPTTFKKLIGIVPVVSDTRPCPFPRLPTPIPSH